MTLYIACYHSSRVHKAVRRLTMMTTSSGLFSRHKISRYLMNGACCHLSFWILREIMWSKNIELYYGLFKTTIEVCQRYDRLLCVADLALPTESVTRVNFCVFLCSFCARKKCTHRYILLHNLLYLQYHMQWNHYLFRRGVSLLKSE